MKNIIAKSKLHFYCTGINRDVESTTIVQAKSVSLIEIDEILKILSQKIFERFFDCVKAFFTNFDLKIVVLGK